MKILGFETTDAVASVAVYIDGKIFSKILNSELRHAESVLPAAESLLSDYSMSTADMDAFAVDIGPGSFTGVRIGVCLANALAFAFHKPVIPVNALEILAKPLQDKGFENIAPVIDAKNGNGYAALYRFGSESIPPYACEILSFRERIPHDSYLTGTACSDLAYPLAENLVKIAAKKEGFSSVSPLYLKLSQAERMMNK